MVAATAARKKKLEKIFVRTQQKRTKFLPKLINNKQSYPILAGFGLSPTNTYPQNKNRE